MSKEEIVIKYVVPRNKVVPAQTLDEIIKSDAVARDKAGNAVYTPLNLYRDNETVSHKSALIARGHLFPFKLGLIFVPNGDQAEHKLKQLWETARSPLFTKALELVLPETDIVTGTLLHAYLEEKIFPEEDSRKQIIEGLLKYDLFHIPYVEVVEIEYREQPATFWHIKTEQVFVTRETEEGERTTYKLPGFGPTWAHLFLKWRCGIEIEYLIRKIQSAYVDPDSIWNPLIEKYKPRYEDTWVKHFDEMKTEAEDAYNNQLEQAGYTPQKAYASTLEMLAPVREAYRHVPEFDSWMKMMEAGVRGEDVRWK